MTHSGRKIATFHLPLPAEHVGELLVDIERHFEGVYVGESDIYDRDKVEVYLPDSEDGSPDTDEPPAVVPGDSGNADDFVPIDFPTLEQAQ